MDFNFLAFLLIAFVPLIVAYFWYRPSSKVVKWANPERLLDLSKLSPPTIVLAFFLSLSIVFGYINLVIHQVGFVELFFTDIILGSEEAEAIVTDFLAKYGDKHRHFGHGAFHGVIIAFVFALPFVTIQALLTEQKRRFVVFHFGYWLVTSILIGGLISQFV
ncbi:MAG: hypothetical protein AAGJ18_24190 [Bacteroidota bacterium]